MKRIISVLLAAALTAVLFSACSSAKTVSTGLGVSTGIGKSTPSKDGKDGTAQVESAVAAITLDSNGAIIKLIIDEPQTRVIFNYKGKITSGLSAAVQSKLEKGENYGMRNASGIGSEWFEQIAALEEWAIGKTVDEVLGLKTKKVDDAHQHVPDEPELTASVTITVGDYMKAIEKAAANAKPIKASGPFKTGLGIVTGIANSADASEGAEGRAQVDSVIAAVTVSDKGKLIACSIDAAQTKVAFDAAGEITADFSAKIMTASELGDDYGLQAASFAEWAVGKTVKEIKEANSSTAGVDTGDFVAAIEKAVANAR